MRLDESRCRGGEPARVAQSQVAWLPAAAASEAVRTLECSEELIAREGIVRGTERIPLRRVERPDAVVIFGLDHVAVRAPLGSCGSAASVSRYRSASSAAMQPAPAEVIAWR